MFESTIKPAPIWFRQLKTIVLTTLLPLFGVIAVQLNLSSKLAVVITTALPAVIQILGLILTGSEEYVKKEELKELGLKVVDKHLSDITFDDKNN